MDYQGAGLAETIKTLNQAGIATVGAGQNATEARRPVIMEVKGQRVAYLSYYDSDLHAATDSQAGTNPRRNDRIAADIKSVRDQVNWVVVNYHWGEEMSKYPGDWQIDLARFTVDQGADLVVGHHAKVLQGAEIYKGRPIVYSLGNFIFSGQSPEQSVSDYDTAVLKVSLKDEKMRVEFLPVEVRNFQARVVKGEQGTKILQQIKNVSDIFDEPLDGPMVLDAKSNTAVSIPEDPTAVTSQPVPPATKTAPVTSEPVFQTDSDHPWNQKNFTAPSREQSAQQDNAFNEERTPQQMPIPTQDQVQPHTTDALKQDSLESAKQRYAQVSQSSIFNSEH
jgi:poly-gamma-glutamate synthesis protein (capsule biosynthesis protein)